MTWQPSDGTILEFAEANDINPPFSCRVGVCGTCMCKISEGAVAYQEEPTGQDCAKTGKLYAKELMQTL